MLQTSVWFYLQEGQWDAMYRDEVLSRYNDAVWLSTLFAFPPASVLHDRNNGKESLFVIL